MYVLLFFLLLCSPGYVWSAQIHALLVGDTEDPQLGKQVRSEIDLAKRRLKSIAKECTLGLNLTTFSAKKGSIKDIAFWLADCHVGKDDVLFFYFSGLGFVEDKTNDAWPTVILDQNMERLAFAELEGAFSKHKARLLVILYDTSSIPVQSEWYYNDDLDDDEAVVLKGHKVRQNYLKNLFVNAKGKVVIAGLPFDGKKEANKKETKRQSFTELFFDQVNKESRHPKASWRHLVAKLSKRYKQKQKQLPLVKVVDKDS